jgi:hypothetical protein
MTGEDCNEKNYQSEQRLQWHNTPQYMYTRSKHESIILKSCSEYFSLPYTVIADHSGCAV